MFRSMSHELNRCRILVATAFWWTCHIGLLWFGASQALAADWPMWRYDAGRSAHTPEQLADQLQLQWTTKQPAPRVAWPEDPRLFFDASLEPIVAGQTLYLASSRNDSLTAINTADGRQLWRFFADGPIRFAPVVVDDKIYFGADDGYFYCVDTAGELVWKFRAAPGQRRAIGNERLISVWAVRGGAVASNGHLFFVAGVWPFEGALLYDVDLSGGQPNWRSRMMEGEASPQGYLASDHDRLFIPRGRENATTFHISTGKFEALNYSSRGKTDYHVSAAGDLLLHGDRVFDVNSNQLLPNPVHRPVTTDTAIFGTLEGNLIAYDLENPQLVEKKDRKGNKRFEKILRRQAALSREQIAIATGQSADTPVVIEIKAGSRLYGFQGSTVFAVDATDGKAQPSISWTAQVDGTPSRLIAASGKLFVATREGAIYCFGPDAGQSSPQARDHEQRDPGLWSDRVAQLLKDTQDVGGYCLVFGIPDYRMIDEILRQSEMHVIVIDSDAQQVSALRRDFDDAGHYGTRLSALVDDPTTVELPPYLATLAVSPSPAAWLNNSRFLEQVFRSLRPYGGQAIFLGSSDDHQAIDAHVQKAQLAGAKVDRRDNLSVVARVGGLPGAADWTHEYGDPSNTLMSRDELVKAPLGVLWFGGPAAANELFFNRHYWPPSLTVNQGRMFLQGPRVFAAIDIYTGRVLWKKPVSEGSSPGRRGNFFERVRVGYHFLASDEAVYFSDGQVCEVLNPATGKLDKTFRFERPEARWGRMRIWEDRLICTVFLPNKSGQHQPSEIVALDRQTGEELWRHKSEYSAPLAALGRERVYFFDGELEGFYDDWKRKGLTPKANDTRYLKALDIRTGKLVWQSSTQRIVTWLGFSERDDILIASNRKGLEAWQGSSGQALWEKEQKGEGFAGHPESVWDKVILWNDRVIDQRGPGLAYDVKTGKPALQAHPLTGELAPWEFTKTGHHCNYAIASPHLLTFRAASAGFLDLESSTTSRLEGFRSGCRNSLIPAGGILNAPNFAHGCVCSYSLFTSLALVHTPKADVWSYSAFKKPNNLVRRVGVNLGAPGDRRAKDGTFWLDYPNVGGPSPEVKIAVGGQSVSYFRRHSREIAGDELPWVAASGCQGLTSLTVQLDNSDRARSCQVKLYFSEPDHATEGARVFDVDVQETPALRDYDIVRAAGGRGRVAVHIIEDVVINGKLEISFTPRVDSPLICGVEVIVAE